MHESTEWRGIVILQRLFVQDLHLILHLLHFPGSGHNSVFVLHQDFKPICEYGTLLAFSNFTLPAKQGVNNWKESIMKKWNVVMIVAGIMIASMIFAGSLSAALIDDMANLDQAYVAALVLSNQPDKPAEAVTASMKRLTESWKKFVDGLSPADRDNTAAEERDLTDQRKCGRGREAGCRRQA